MMSAGLPLKVLILEDRATDAELMLDELRQSGFQPEWQRVETKGEYLASLTPTLEVILADYKLPQFDGLTALALLQDSGLDIPFILVSGSIGEEQAVAAMKQGAADYLLKDRLGRLGQAVSKAIADKKLREGQRSAVEELRRLKEFHENIVQTMTEGIVILDANGVISFANPAAAAIVGYTPEEAVGLDLQHTKLFVAGDQHLIFDVAVEQRERGEVKRRDIDILRKDGTRRSLLISSSPQYEDGRFAGTLTVLTDVTEQKNTENDLRKLYTAVEQSGSSVVMTDLQGNIEYVNPGFTRVTGYAADEVIGKNPRLLKSGETTPEVYKELWDTVTGGDVWRGELHNRKKSGELFWEMATISPVKDNEGHVTSYLAVKEEITERKRAEEEISSLARFPAENPQPVLRLGDDGCILYANGKAQLLLAELGVAVGDDAPTPWCDLVACAVASRSSKTIEFQQGDRIWALLAVPILEMGYVNVYGTDITERRLAENLLVSERNLLRTLIDSLPDRIYAKDAEGRFTLKNEADARQMGAASTNDVIGKTDFDYYPSGLAAQYRMDDLTVIQSGQPLVNREEAFTDSDGNSGWMLTTKVPLRDAQGKVIGLVGTGRNITVLKQAETNLRKLNRTLAVLSDVNQAITRIRSTAELFEKICQIAVKTGGFQLAWVGLLDPETQSVNPVAHAGISGNYLEKLGIELSDEPRGQGPTATTLRTGERFIVNDMEHDPHVAPWREDALQLGYRASAAFPLNLAGEVRGVLNLYANQTDFFDDEEIQILDEVAADISFAMQFAEQEAQRQQAETALKLHVQAVEAMRLFLQTTLDAFPASTVVLAPDGTILNVNAAWIHFSDNNSAPSAMHYIGANYLTTCDTAAGMGAEEAAPVATGIRAMIAGSQNEFYLEYPCHSPTERRWFALHVTPFSEPAPRRVVVAHINVTERRLAQEAEQEQRRFAEALRDSLAALTASLDVDTVMHQILNNAAQVVPYESASIIQFEADTARASYLSGFLPEAEAFFKDFQYNKPYPEHLARIEENQPYLIADTRLITDWINIPLVSHVRSSMGVPIIMTDGLLGMLSVDSSTPNRYTAEDVERLKIFARYAAIALENAYHAAKLEQKVVERTAELQTAKERVELILSNSADAILLLQHDFTIQQTNTSFNDMFDCEQADYFGQPVTALIELNAEDVLSTILKNLLDHRKVSVDVAARRKNGTLFAVELSIVSINEDGFVCTFHDISQRKQVEQSLRTAVEKEKELNELKTRFVSMASHELRTPLATIRAITETVSAYRHKLTEDQIDKKLNNILDQVDFLKDIMDDVLQLARLQARRVEYKPSKLDLETLLRDILDEFRSHPNNTHQFLYLCETSILPIYADKKLIRQLINNVLSNAVKYSLPDQPITVRLQQVDGLLVFSVHDGGIGIPEADLTHLFEPFHRASNVGTIHGTGLGLVIAKEAVDLHGGTLSVESQLGVGTTFTVRLPVAVEGKPTYDENPADRR